MALMNSTTAGLKIASRSKTKYRGAVLKLPDMLTAVVAHPPVCGGKVKSFNADKATAVPGVVKVKQIGSGVAVLAKDFWTARTARDEIEIEWDEGENAALSTEALRKEYLELADRPGNVAEDEGDAEATLSSAAKTVEGVYEVPFLAHAPMEPLNATAHVQADRCDIWAGTQAQSIDQMVAAGITGLSPAQVHIHTTLLGGGFGRRANFTSDFVSDAVQVAHGEGVPVKTIWTREDDIQCGYYRPMFVHKVKAGVDADGMPIAWHQRLVGESIAEGTMMEQAVMQNGVDMMSVEGAAHMPYAIPNRHVEVHNAKKRLSVLWWRSVGHTHTGFVNESFLDEVAHAGGKDPFELRRELLKDQPRHRHVLELAAEKAGWGTPLPEGRARGIAMRKSFESFVAEVADVSVALLHGPEQIADLPVPVGESPGAVSIGHAERGHLVEYLAPNSVFNSLPRQRSSPHLGPHDRLVTIDRVLHHASLGAA